MIEKINKDIKENKNKIDYSFIEFMKNIKFNIKQFKLKVELGTEDAALTSIIIPEGVRELSEASFSGCQSLKTVILPEGIKKLEYATFQRMYSFGKNYSSR